MIHLDTGFLIQALQPGSKEEPSEAAETALKVLGEPVPVDRQAAERAAALFNEGGRRRGSLGDCLIAATAIEAGARLATGNTRDFERFVKMGLVLAD